MGADVAVAELRSEQSVADAEKTYALDAGEACVVADRTVASVSGTAPNGFAAKRRATVERHTPLAASVAFHVNRSGTFDVPMVTPLAMLATGAVTTGGVVSAAAVVEKAAR